MIPKIIYFIYLYDKNSVMPLNINHYLCIKSQAIVNRPHKIIILTNNPEEFHQFPWMRRLMAELDTILEVVPVDRITEYKGNKIVNPTQESDILRFNTLIENGGMYLDLDVLAINPIPSSWWESNRTIQAIEPDRRGVCGLGSAVIMAPMGSEFLKEVLVPYQRYDYEIKKGLYELPIFRPYRLGLRKKILVNMAPSKHFYPVYYFYDECQKLFFLDAKDELIDDEVYQMHLWENRNKGLMKYLEEDYFMKSNATYAQLGKEILLAKYE